MLDKNKNHLIMINTSSKKELKVILDYLSTKQCEVSTNNLYLRTQDKKYNHNHQHMKLEELLEL